MAAEAADAVRRFRAETASLYLEAFRCSDPAEKALKLSQIVERWLAIPSMTNDPAEQHRAHLALLGLLGADDPRRQASQDFVDGARAEREATLERERAARAEREATLERERAARAEATLERERAVRAEREATLEHERKMAEHERKMAAEAETQLADARKRLAAMTLATSAPSPSLYVEYGQRFNDKVLSRPDGPSNWKELVDGSNDAEVAGLVKALKDSLIVKFGDLGQLEGAKEADIQSWFNTNLCGEGKNLSGGRIWHDTHDRPSLSADTVEGHLKPDETLTTERGLTAAGLVMLVELKCGGSLSIEAIGQALSTAEAALRKGVFLRSRLYQLLTNVVSATLFVCSLNTQRQVTVESYAQTGTIDETLRLLVSLMFSSDEKLDVPFQAIREFPVIKPLGRGHYFGTVVSIRTDSNTTKFAKIHREQSDRDRELEILRSLGQDASPFTGVHPVDFEHRGSHLFAIVGSPVRIETTVPK